MGFYGSVLIKSVNFSFHFDVYTYLVLPKIKVEFTFKKSKNVEMWFPLNN